MSAPTLYLDYVILAAALYPSGFSGSLAALVGRPPRSMSHGFLALLALPCLAVPLAAWALRPELLALRGAPPLWLAVGLVAAPVALALEYGIHLAAFGGAARRGPRRLTLHGFWGGGPSGRGRLLLVLVAFGEELLYRQLWIGVLAGPLGMPAAAAAGVAALAYGLNHLSFGVPSVAAKTASGAIYGILFVASGGSVWVPILTHLAQNEALLLLARRGGAAGAHA